MRKCHRRIKQLEADATQDKSRLPTAMKGCLEFAIQATHGYIRALYKVLQTQPATLLLNKLQVQKSNTDSMVLAFELTEETQAQRSSGRVPQQNMRRQDNIGNNAALTDRAQRLEELKELQTNLINQIEELSAKKLQEEVHLMEQIYYN